MKTYDSPKKHQYCRQIRTKAVHLESSDGLDLPHKVVNSSPPPLRH